MPLINLRRFLRFLNHQLNRILDLRNARHRRLRRESPRIVSFRGNCPRCFKQHDGIRGFLLPHLVFLVVEGEESEAGCAGCRLGGDYC